MASSRLFSPRVMPMRMRKVKALDKGAVAFLYKPFADEALFAAIRVALSQ